MELFRQEHKKLWRKRSVRISVLLCILYVVVLSGFLSYQYIGFGSFDAEQGHGRHFDGYSNIKAKQAYAAQFAGELTDEKIQAMTADFQRLMEEDKYKATEVTDYSILNTWIWSLWPELTDYSDYRNIVYYAPPDKLTGFYERRDAALKDFLDLSMQTGEEQEYLLSIDQKTQKPYHYEWYEGWGALLNSTVGELGTVLALFLAIALSPMFSGEWHSNTRNVIASTRNGRSRIALAKTGAAMAFSLELFFMLFLGNVILQLIYFGTIGWDQPVQLLKSIAIAPMNMLQAELYEYGYVLLAAVGFTGLILLISVLCKSNFISLILSLAVVYVPKVTAQFLPRSVQMLLDLVPFVGDPRDIFRTYTYHLFGKYIWSPYLLIIVPVCIGLICLPFAVKSWAKSAKS